MKNTIICFLFLTFSIHQIYGQEFVKTTGDSLNMLSTKDTIIISLGEYQQKKIQHNLAKGQTIYAISKFYGLTATELLDHNPALNESDLPIGYPIDIPIPLKALKMEEPLWANRFDFVPVFYEVAKSETLYRIAKRYFKMNVETLQIRNGLPDFNLHVGQKLLIGWLHRDGVSQDLRMKAISKWERKNLLYKNVYYKEASKRKKNKKDIGMAQWLASKGAGGKDFYALHNGAPMNSIIRVTNKLTNRIVYAKVIGRIPRARYHKQVKVVLSSTAAKILNAIDSRFYVEVEYHK